MRVLHLITSLDAAGAQSVLLRLAGADRENGHRVVSLLAPGAYAGEFESAGIPVQAVGLPRGRVTLSGLARLRGLLREARPDVLQTWMYHADLVGGLAGRLAGLRAIVWGLRNADLDPRAVPAATRAVVRACALASGLLPRRIVSCSQRAAVAHAALGYRAERIVVVPNGYDLERLRPDAQARNLVRAALGVGPATALLGMVARWHPHKDHGNLLAALAQLGSAGVRDWRCLLAGEGMDPGNADLARALGAHGLEGRVLLLGPRADVPALMNALDLHVLSSFGEAFPNVVAEAMACGTPAVCTDAGDAALILGDTGWLVPVADPAALAAALREALAELSVPERRQARQAACRARIVAEFGLERMVRAYRAVWEAARRS